MSEVNISEMRDERREITALFADLVGSTALGEQLDIEELKLIVGDAVARMVESVEAFGGTVKDLAGDGVLALFGAPLAHEDDPERAIRAALRIVDEISVYGREMERAWGIVGFGVRVGVQTGMVVVGAIGGGGRVEFGAMGDAVNTAARLQSQAEPGMVLVGDATRRLSEPLFDWGEPRTLELKGKADPLERRGEAREVALVLFKLALALHMSLRFAEANDTYQRAFGHWSPPEPSDVAPTATLRVATSFLPNDPDPRSAIAWPNIQLCMQLFDRLVEAWPERTIVPSLAERWEIADDGLRYVFHLRDGLTWSDGEPLTACDVEFGIKRVLNPEAPGSSAAIYFVLEHGLDAYLGHERDLDRVGVRALDDRTVEFRLSAPAPYFMGVVNRPDAGPQPRHAIEPDGDAWVDAGRQVVSGPFEIVSRDGDEVVLERRTGYRGLRPGNIARVEHLRAFVADAVLRYARDELDMIAVRYTPRLADLMPDDVPDATLGPAAWSGYLAFDHTSSVTSSLDLRLALAYAVDRERLAGLLPVNMVVATGGIVPPALQGHTPDIELRLEPELAREHLRRSGFDGVLGLACLDADLPVLEAIIESWRGVLHIEVEPRTWSVEAMPPRPTELAPIHFTGWLPGYGDPEYFLRLLFQSDSRTNEGGFAYPRFDDLIERARQERSDRGRLELFHEADRMAVADRVAVIPLVYGRSLAVVKPWLHGWWEFGKSSPSFADLVVDRSSPRA